jgi:nitroreductase
MEVNEAIISRHSVRDFKSNPVPKAMILKILETAVHAPSTVNSQPWNIYAAAGVAIERIRKAYVEKSLKGIRGSTDIFITPFSQLPKVMVDRMTEMRKVRTRLMGLDPEDPVSQRIVFANSARLFNAPVILVLTMDRVLDRWSVYDMGLLSQNIMIAAQDVGLGSIPALSLVSHPDILRPELDIPDSQIIVIGIALGYTNTASGINRYVSSRREITETVTFKGF